MPRMEGWCTPTKAEVLMAEIRAAKPKVCVEVGVFGGRSLIAIALGLQTNQQGVVYGIDPWKAECSVEGWNDENREYWSRVDHERIFLECCFAVKFLGLTDHVRIIRKTSREAVHVLPDDAIDLLHIDGNHSEDQALEDVRLYASRVTPGGLIWFDDANWATTTKAREELLRTCDLLRVVDNCAAYRKRAEVAA